MNFKTLLLSSVIGLTSIFTGVSEVEARPNRIVNFTSSTGADVWLKPIGYNSVEVLVDNQYRGTGFIGTMNCSNGDYQWRSNTGWTKRGMAKVLIEACKF